MWIYILLILGFILLIKGADFLVEGSASIARRFQISDLVIGLTVVAFGTSSPELFVNTVASVQGNTGIAIGNIIGSNIANILLILGLSAVISPLLVEKGVAHKGIPLSTLAALVLFVLSNDTLIDKDASSAITRIDGLVFIFFFIVFLYYSFGAAKTIEEVKEHAPSKKHGLVKSSLYVIIGLAALVIGGKWIVDGAEYIASSFGVSQTIIGLTVVAVGTSLPELATSAMAAYKKRVEIAVGSVIGSSVFNIFFVLGISSAIKPLPFQEAYNIDIGVLIAANFILFFSLFSGKKRSVDRWEGILFILIYLVYIVSLLFRG